MSFAWNDFRKNNFGISFLNMGLNLNTGRGWYTFNIINHFLYNSFLIFIPLFGFPLGLVGL